MKYQFGAAYLAIIVLGLPLLELVGIYQTWQMMGAWTLLWLLAAIFAGFSLIATERATFLPRLTQALAQGMPPLTLIKTSGLRFLAGILLIIPGVFSDGVALIFLLASLFGAAPKADPVAGKDRPGAHNRDSAHNADVIEGDYRRID